MLNHLFPKQITNQYSGPPIALWMFAVMTAVSIARSLAHIFLPDGGAQSIATIPLGAFSPAAAAVVIGLFAQWGLTQLMFGLLFALVLWRYRSLVPLMWAFIFLEWTGRLLLGFYKPFETVGTAPGAVGNRIFPVLALLMLIFSLRAQKDAQNLGKPTR